MAKIEVKELGENSEVYNGQTVQAGTKYFIISKSPFNNEVMVFRCDSKGHCTNMRHIWLGFRFDDAKAFLAEKQR